MDDDEDWSDPEIFYGFGSVHDLADAPEDGRPRLLGMRSVADGAAWALSGGKPKARVRRRRMGFRVPRS